MTTTMATGQVNPTNAPREVSKLQTLGPFMLKRLMEQGCAQLGIVFDDQRKQAFLRDPLDKRASDVLEILQQIDATGGGAPPAEVSPALPAASQAPAAAAPTEDKPPKTPVTRGGAKANGAVNGTNGAASHAPSNEGVEILQGLVGAIKEISQGVTAMHKTVKELDNGSKRFDALEVKLDQMFKLQHLTFALIAQIAENACGAPAKDVLEAAASEYANLEPTVTSLISGK